MKRKVERQILTWLLGLITLLGVPRAGSASDDEGEFILRCSPEAIHEVVRRHGLTLIHSHGSQDIHFVRAPAAARPEHFLSDLRSDPDVKGIEPDTDLTLPEAPPGLKNKGSTVAARVKGGTRAAFRQRVQGGKLRDLGARLTTLFA